MLAAILILLLIESVAISLFQVMALATLHIIAFAPSVHMSLEWKREIKSQILMLIILNLQTS